MNYDEDYLPELLSGTYLHDQLELGGHKELVVAIVGITAESFNDAKAKQWVLSFGTGMPKLRIKPAIGASLRQALGPDSRNWIGKRIALSVEPIEWEDSATGEKKSGFTIKARPVGDGEAADLPSPPPNDLLDDDIPF